MDTHAKVKALLSVAEIGKRYRACKDARVRTWWQAIWLRAQGKGTSEVAQTIGCKPDWVRRLVRRWNGSGPESFKDCRESNGRAALLSLEHQAELMQDLMGPSPDGGLWNGHKVARWITDKTGCEVPYNRGWIYMRDLGLTSQTPRPRHRDADKIKQEEFKKNSPNYIPILAIFAQKQKSRSGRRMRKGLA